MLVKAEQRTNSGLFSVDPLERPSRDHVGLPPSWLLDTPEGSEERRKDNHPFLKSIAFNRKLELGKEISVKPDDKKD